MTHWVSKKIVNELFVLESKVEKKFGVSDNKRTTEHEARYLEIIRQEFEFISLHDYAVEFDRMGRFLQKSIPCSLEHNQCSRIKITWAYIKKSFFYCLFH